MPRLPIVLMLAASMLLPAGCARRTSRTPEPGSTPFDELPYREGAPPPGTRFFLVAGGSDIANFAGEVVSQRNLWLAQGFSADEIACYYAKPTARAYREDREQYDALMPHLADCFAARPAVVNAHLKAAAQADLPFLYLYVTGHGLGSVGRAMARSGNFPKLMPTLTPEERKLLDRPAVGLEANGGPGIDHPESIVTAARQGKSLPELMFTSDVLADALAGLKPETPKYVVVQACYSGAFLPRDDDADHPLRRVENLTMLTATRRNRPSFGCGAADVATYFGGAITRVMARALDEGEGPGDLPWRDIHDDTAFLVDTWERVEGERPSEPQILVTE